MKLSAWNILFWFIFHTTPQFGIKYPLPKSDLLAIPDFAAGAMENWGAVTYRESRLLIDPERTSLQTKTACTRTVKNFLFFLFFSSFS